MAPPPPSQAGKFKPRKPAKKIRIGEATGAGPPSSSSAAGTAAGTAGAGAGASGRGGGGRGGSGRGGRGGGRGGRGRGRHQAPQGQVFFTGASQPATAAGATTSAGAGGGGTKTGGTNAPTGAAAAAANSKKGRAAAGTSKVVAGSKNRRDSAQQEEIVGLMDEGVGNKPDAPLSTSSSAAAAAAAAKKKKALEDEALEDDDGGAGRASSAARGNAKPNAQAEGYFYDDDSSDDSSDDDDGVGGARAMLQESTLQPLELPFFPPREGAAAATAPRRTPTTTTPPEKVGSGPSAADLPANRRSFFSTETTGQLGEGETKTENSKNNNDWFLVQLPTRLPPIQKDDAAAASASTFPDNRTENSPPSQQQHVPVNVAPLQTDRFDNELATAVPGRLGKIVVYRSGKTILVLEGPDGSPSIRMNVTEHGCAFRQQAVVVDKDEGRMVLLGDVPNTIVATPDLVGEFSAAEQNR